MVDFQQVEAFSSGCRRKDLFQGKTRRGTGLEEAEMVGLPLGTFC